MLARLTRTPILLFAILALGTGLGGCDRFGAKAEDRAPSTRTLQISQKEEPPTPPTLPAPAGKLAVMDSPPVDIVPAIGPVSAVPPAVPSAAAPKARAWQPPRNAGEADDYRTPAMSRRECRRAARRGDWIADSDECQRLLQADEDDSWRPDWRLASDCRRAANAGDAFADEQICRDILGR